MRETTLLKKIYLAFDGMEFYNKEECQKYEAELKRQNENEERVFNLDSGKTLTKNEVKEFFRKMSCDKCPFSKECRAMEQRIRCSTTDTFCLCDTILGNINV